MARGRYRQREYPPHRRTPATVEEQLPGSSFSHFFSKPVAVQVGDQSRMYADTRQKSEASASCYVQVLRSIKQVLHDRTSTKGRTPAARDPLQSSRLANAPRARSIPGRRRNVGEPRQAGWRDERVAEARHQVLLTVMQRGDRHIPDGAVDGPHDGLGAHAVEVLAEPLGKYDLV